MAHDFLDDEWQQGSSDDPNESPKRQRPPRPRRPRGKGGIAILATVAVMLGVTAAWSLWGSRPSMSDPEPTAAATSAAEPTESAETASTSEEPTSEASEIPPADASVEEIVTRWATRSSAGDQTWNTELAGRFAPDAARRATGQGCLPLEGAPVNVNDATAASESEGAEWDGTVDLVVSDKTGTTTPLALRVSALWDETNEQWVLTSLQCVASGGE